MKANGYAQIRRKKMLAKKNRRNEQRGQVRNLMADFYFSLKKSHREEDEEEKKSANSPRSPQFSSVCDDEED